MIGVGIIRPRAERSAKIVRRFIDTSLMRESRAEIVGEQRLVRLRAQRRREVGGRFVGLALTQESVPEVVQGVGVVRLYLKRGPKMGDPFVEVALLHQRVPEGVVRKPVQLGHTQCMRAERRGIRPIPQLGTGGRGAEEGEQRRADGGQARLDRTAG